MLTHEIHEDKIQIQLQWDNNPCGDLSSSAKDLPPQEYYRQVRDARYKNYAPWMHKAIRFDEYQNKKVLEVGVGIGSDHLQFALNGNQMTALDLSREHLRKTRGHLELFNLQGQFVYGDAENMPFSKETFDVVYSFGAIHHTPDIQKTIKEIHRVLKPGGEAIVGVYHKYSLFFWVATILCRGILKGQLFYKTWKHFISEIEFRSDNSSACPIVTVYSRREMRALFSDFSDVRIESYHVEPNHLSAFRYLLPFLKNRELLERKFSRFGWYLIIKARK